MSDDLVERVARAIYEAWCAFHGVTKTSMPWDDVWGEERQACIAEARAAIALVLEEAAKVAGKWQQMYFEDEKVHSSNITEYIVSDIRALIKEPT